MLIIRLFSRLRLRVKFSLTIIGLVVLIIGVVLYLIYSQQEQSILAEVETRTIDLATVLAFAGVRASLEDNYLVLQELVDSIKNREEILRVMILDTTGRVMVHNYTGERGEVYLDSLSQLAIRSRSSIVSTYTLDKEQVKDVATPIIVSGRKVATARVIISLEHAELAIQKLAREIELLGVASIIVALVAAAFLSGLVIKPLQRLYRDAKEIAKGEREIQINVTAHDEIGTLQRALKTMIEEVHTKARLAALGTTMANLAHEIRAPLASIMKHVNEFIGKEQDPKLLAEKSHKVLAEINRLNNLVKQLLNFSEKRKLVRSRTNVNSIIDQALFVVDGPLKERRIKLTRDFAPVPVIAADKNLLQSVFVNLISNAIDAMEEEGSLYLQTQVRTSQSEERAEAPAANGKPFTGETGAIPALFTGAGLTKQSQAAKSPAGNLFRFLRKSLKRFFVESSERTQRIPLHSLPEQDAIVITITDDGCGIPAEKMDQLFLPFFTTKKSGTGLGLALSHKIIQEHNGAIQVESKEGMGTTFRITLPI
jgi:signal transduction histidine kinase